MRGLTELLINIVAIVRWTNGVSADFGGRGTLHDAEQRDIVPFANLNLPRR